MAASESETTAEKAVARDHAAAAAAATSNAMVAVSAFVPSESALSHEKRIASAIRLWKMRNAHVTKVVEMKIDKEEVVSGLKRARQRAQSTLCAGASAAADALAEGDEQESGCYDDAWRRVRAVRSVPGARDDANDRDAAAECRHLADAFARMASAYRWERVALAAKKARARDTLDGDSVSAITQRSEFLAHAESSLLARSRRLTKGAYARDITIAAADATVLPTPGDWRIAARARVFQAATRARAIEPIVNRLKWIGFTHRRVLLLRGVGNADDRCGADETFWIAVTPPDLALDYDNLRRMFDALATQWHVMRDRGEPHGHIADYNIRRHFAEILQRQERLLTPGRAVDDTGEDLNASRGTGASVLTINPTPSAVSDPYAAPPPVRLPVRRYGNEPPPPIVLADEMLEGVDLGVGLQSLAVDAVGARSKGLSMNMTDGSNVASGEHKDGPGSRVAETLLLEEERLAPESTLVDEFDAEKAETQIKGLAKMQLDRIDYLHEEHSRFANRLEKDVTYRKKKARAVSNNMKPVQAQTAARDAAAASGQLPPRPPGRRATIPPPHVSIMDEARHSFFGPSSELGFGGDAEAALLAQADDMQGWAHEESGSSSATTAPPPMDNKLEPRLAEAYIALSTLTCRRLKARVLAATNATFAVRHSIASLEEKEKKAFETSVASRGDFGFSEGWMLRLRLPSGAYGDTSTPVHNSEGDGADVESRRAANFVEAAGDAASLQFGKAGLGNGYELFYGVDDDEQDPIGDDQLEVSDLLGTVGAGDESIPDRASHVPHVRETSGKRRRVMFPSAIREVNRVSRQELPTLAMKHLRHRCETAEQVMLARLQNEVLTGVASRPVDWNPTALAKEAGKYEKTKADRFALLVSLWRCEASFSEARWELVKTLHDLLENASDVEDRAMLRRQLLEATTHRPIFDEEFNLWTGSPDVDEEGTLRMLNVGPRYVSVYATECAILKLEAQLLAKVRDGLHMNELGARRNLLRAVQNSLAKTSASAEENDLPEETAWRALGFMVGTPGPDLDGSRDIEREISDAETGSGSVPELIPLTEAGSRTVLAAFDSFGAVAGAHEVIGTLRFACKQFCDDVGCYGDTVSPERRRVYRAALEVALGVVDESLTEGERRATAKVEPRGASSSSQTQNYYPRSERTGAGMRTSTDQLMESYDWLAFDDAMDCAATVDTAIESIQAQGDIDVAYRAHAMARGRVVLLRHLHEAELLRRIRLAQLHRMGVSHPRFGEPTEVNWETTANQFPQEATDDDIISEAKKEMRAFKEVAPWGFEASHTGLHYDAMRETPGRRVELAAAAFDGTLASRLKKRILFRELLQEEVTGVGETASASGVDNEHAQLERMDTPARAAAILAKKTVDLIQVAAMMQLAYAEGCTLAVRHDALLVDFAWMMSARRRIERHTDPFLVERKQLKAFHGVSHGAAIASHYRSWTQFLAREEVAAAGSDARVVAEKRYPFEFLLSLVRVEIARSWKNGCSAISREAREVQQRIAALNRTGRSASVATPSRVSSPRSTARPSRSTSVATLGSSSPNSQPEQLQPINIAKARAILQTNLDFRAIQAFLLQIGYAGDKLDIYHAGCAVTTEYLGGFGACAVAGCADEPEYLPLQDKDDSIWGPVFINELELIGAATNVVVTARLSRHMTRTTNELNNIPEFIDHLLDRGWPMRTAFKTLRPPSTSDCLVSKIGTLYKHHGKSPRGMELISEQFATPSFKYIEPSTPTDQITIFGSFENMAPIRGVFVALARYLRGRRAVMSLDVPKEKLRDQGLRSRSYSDHDKMVAKLMLESAQQGMQLKMKEEGEEEEEKEKHGVHLTGGVGNLAHEVHKLQSEVSACNEPPQRFGEAPKVELNADSSKPGQPTPWPPPRIPKPKPVEERKPERARDKPTASEVSHYLCLKCMTNDTAWLAALQICLEESGDLYSIGHETVLRSTYSGLATPTCFDNFAIEARNKSKKRNAASPWSGWVRQHSVYASLLNDPEAFEPLRDGMFVSSGRDSDGYKPVCRWESASLLFEDEPVRHKVAYLIRKIEAESDAACAQVGILSHDDAKRAADVKLYCHTLTLAVHRCRLESIRLAGHLPNLFARSNHELPEISEFRETEVAMPVKTMRPKAESILMMREKEATDVMEQVLMASLDYRKPDEDDNNNLEEEASEDLLVLNRPLRQQVIAETLKLSFTAFSSMPAVKKIQRFETELALLKQACDTSYLRLTHVNLDIMMSWTARRRRRRMKPLDEGVGDGTDDNPPPLMDADTADTDRLRQSGVATLALPPPTPGLESSSSFDSPKESLVIARFRKAKNIAGRYGKAYWSQVFGDLFDWGNFYLHSSQMAGEEIRDSQQYSAIANDNTAPAKDEGAVLWGRDQLNAEERMRNVMHDTFQQFAETAARALAEERGLWMVEMNRMSDLVTELRAEVKFLKDAAARERSQVSARAMQLCYQRAGMLLLNHASVRDQFQTLNSEVVQRAHKLKNQSDRIHGEVINTLETSLAIAKTNRQISQEERRRRLDVVLADERSKAMSRLTMAFDDNDDTLDSVNTIVRMEHEMELLRQNEAFLKASLKKLRLLSRMRVFAVRTKLKREMRELREYYDERMSEMADGRLSAEQAVTSQQADIKVLRHMAALRDEALGDAARELYHAHRHRTELARFKARNERGVEHRGGASFADLVNGDGGGGGSRPASTSPHPSSPRQHRSARSPSPVPTAASEGHRETAWTPRELRASTEEPTNVTEWRLKLFRERHAREEAERALREALDDAAEARAGATAVQFTNTAESGWRMRVKNLKDELQSREQELLVLRQTLEAISGMDTEITLDEARELARDGVRIALESGRRRDPTLARPHSAETFMRSSDAEILAQKRFPKRPSSAVVAQRNSSLLPSRGGVSASGRDRPSSAQLQQRIARNLKETHGGVRVTEFGGAAAYKGTVTSAPPRVAFGRGVDAVATGAQATAYRMIRRTSGEHAAESSSSSRARPASAHPSSRSPGSAPPPPPQQQQQQRPMSAGPVHRN